jgi:hypothetical protein
MEQKHVSKQMGLSQNIFQYLALVDRGVGLVFLAEPIYKPLVLLKFIFDPETFSWVDRTSIDFF